MNSPATYIYPQWLAAIRDLEDKLEATPKQWRVLREWFEKHVFECGVDVVIHQEMAIRSEPDELKKHVTYDSARQLAEAIMKTECYMQQRTQNERGDTNFRTTVLLCGAPLLVGKEKRW